MADHEKPRVQKIRKYRKPININIGIVIFAAIFVYICICISMYFKDNHIKPYEVREGSLYSENLYTGIALREETVVTASEAGYVNYFAQEGQRVAKGNLVYTIDGTGKLADYVSNEKLGENSLSTSDLMTLKSDISRFVHSFSSGNFSSTYDLKYEIKGTVLKFANATLMESIADMKNSDLGTMVNLSYAPETGIVMYWTDGYETLQPEQVTSSILKKTDYEKKQLLGNNLVSEQDAVYKACSNEDWSIVIAVDDVKAKELEEAEYVKVKFVKTQDESWASVTILHNEDKQTFAKLSFTNSMITYVNDRFLEIELMLHDESGLKIPNTSIVEREFFLIPEEYITKSGDSDSTGVLRETVLEDGTRSTEYVDISIYSEGEGEYYVDAGVLQSGDHLFKTDSTETFTISKKATLIGVFNMNKGYADFKQIEILYQNDEYAIVKSNTKYGLNVYDLIVQNASSVHDEQFIYK